MYKVEREVEWKYRYSGVRNKSQKCSARYVDRVLGSLAPLWSGADQKICSTRQNIPEGEWVKTLSTQYIYVCKQTNKYGGP